MLPLWEIITCRWYICTTRTHTILDKRIQFILYIWFIKSTTKFIYVQNYKSQKVSIFTVHFSIWFLSFHVYEFLHFWTPRLLWIYMPLIPIAYPKAYTRPSGTLPINPHGIDIIHKIVYADIQWWCFIYPVMVIKKIHSKGALISALPFIAFRRTSWKRYANSTGPPNKLAFRVFIIFFLRSYKNQLPQPATPTYPIVI